MSGADLNIMCGVPVFNTHPLEGNTILPECPAQLLAGFNQLKFFLHFVCHCKVSYFKPSCVIGGNHRV